MGHRVRIMMGGVLLALFSLGSVPTRAADWPIEVVVEGPQDVSITCEGNHEPIIVSSQYCGSTNELGPSGTVIFLTYTGSLSLVGWDNEDLTEGGQVDPWGAAIRGRSAQAAKWWRDLAALDNRFTVHALPFSPSPPSTVKSCNEAERMSARVALLVEKARYEKAVAEPEYRQFILRKPHESLESLHTDLNEAYAVYHFWAHHVKVNGHIHHFRTGMESSDGQGRE